MTSATQQAKSNLRKIFWCTRQKIYSSILHKVKLGYFKILNRHTESIKSWLRDTFKPLIAFNPTISCYTQISLKKHNHESRQSNNKVVPKLFQNINFQQKFHILEQKFEKK